MRYCASVSARLHSASVFSTLPTAGGALAPWLRGAAPASWLGFIAAASIASPSSFDITERILLVRVRVDRLFGFRGACRRPGPVAARGPLRCEPGPDARYTRTPGAWDGGAAGGNVTTRSGPREPSPRGRPEGVQGKGG